MARTAKDIQTQINTELSASRPDLSPSAVAEWRLWTWIVAVAIASFENILDIFRAEMDAVADKITPGTARWYAEQAKRFQNGHELIFNDKTAELCYAVDDPSARIISVVAVTERPMSVSIKVAKRDSSDKIVPLSPDELYNFDGYIDSIKFAGIETSTISTTADALRYNLDVYFDPAVPSTAVRTAVIEALDRFRTSLGFNSMLYKQRMIDAVMSVRGVVTVDMVALDRKSTSMAEFAPVAVAEELEAGYFDYANNCTLTLKSTR